MRISSFPGLSSCRTIPMQAETGPGADKQSYAMFSRVFPWLCSGLALRLRLRVWSVIHARIGLVTPLFVLRNFVIWKNEADDRAHREEEGGWEEGE